ncbi:MAG: hypothetical protein R2705_24735 [Ilumatobacteraceae bacterium]
MAGLLGTVAIIAVDTTEFARADPVRFGAIGFLAALVIAHTAFRAPVTLLAASATTWPASASAVWSETSITRSSDRGAATASSNCSGTAMLRC